MSDATLQIIVYSVTAAFVALVAYEVGKDRGRRKAQQDGWLPSYRGGFVDGWVARHKEEPVPENLADPKTRETLNSLLR